MRNQINKKGSALMITLILTVIVTLIMIYFIEKIVPISRTVKGIENSNMAYYNGQSAIEQALLFMSGGSPGVESGAIFNISNPSGYSFQITASGKTIPTPGEGNSEYDNNWNRIGPGEPIQLVIPNGINWNLVNFYFKVPNMNSGTTITLTGGTDLPIINWSISGNDSSGSGISLQASGSQITVATNQIFPSNSSGAIKLDNLVGEDLNGSGYTLSNFYNNSIYGLGSNGNNCAGNKCTLKLSIINPLISTDGESIPYLEYRIELGTTNPSIPLQYSKIISSGYSYGFKRSLNRDVRQLTTSEALDFTVFQ